MTPKEKATELSNKYFEQFLAFGEYLSIEKANQCALIAVDEIINSGPLEPNDTEDWLQPEDWFSDANISAEKYWNEVKNEINKI
jgi:hypothetical protein